MNETDDSLRDTFAARTLQGPSASLRERVLAIPERSADGRRSWPTARSRGTADGLRFLLVAAVISASLVALWAAVGQQPSPAEHLRAWQHRLRKGRRSLGCECRRNWPGDRRAEGGRCR